MTTTELDRALHTQVLKREKVKERAYQEERAKYEEEFTSNLGMGGTEMSKQELKKIIDSDRRMYYRTEELNDKLYIHYKGWRDLKNLDGWTGLKTLYAECNAFSRITGLQNCRQLRSLFLQENCIHQISGLENLPDLWSLNLSSNFIERIEGLENCKRLNTLIVAKNKLGFGGVEDLEALADTDISTLDIQDNRIDDPDVLPEVFARMRDLRVMYMKGNPAAKKIVNYRKGFTVYCKELRYLDDRPVFEDDRRAAEAFNRGGLEEERAERRRMTKEKSEKHDRNMRLFQEMIDRSKLEKRERDAMRKEDKFTDESDPVDSPERRQRRMIEQWKKDNSEDLKDDAKEHALKCLAAEREGRSADEQHETDEGRTEENESVADNSAQAARDSRCDAAESADTGADAEASAPAVKVDNRKLVYEDIWDDQPSRVSEKDAPEKKKKEDNRKLVYDDIWDDVPSSRAPSSGSAPAATARAPAGPPTSLAPAATDGLFMPWADGAVGMDAVAPSKEALEKRKAAMRAGAADSKDSQDAEAKPTWHSQYQAKMAETQAQLQRGTTSFEPPSRSAGPTVAAAMEQKAATTSSPPAQGELDEMD